MVFVALAWVETSMKHKLVREEPVGLVTEEKGGEAFVRVVQCNVRLGAILGVDNLGKTPCLGGQGRPSTASASE